MGKIYFNGVDYSSLSLSDVDSSLSKTSTKPLQNKVVTRHIEAIGAELAGKENSYINANRKMFVFSSADELAEGWKGLGTFVEDMSEYPMSFTMRILTHDIYCGAPTIQGSIGYDGIKILYGSADAIDPFVTKIGLFRFSNNYSCLGVYLDSYVQVSGTPFSIFLECYDNNDSFDYQVSLVEPDMASWTLVDSVDLRAGVWGVNGYFHCYGLERWNGTASLYFEETHFAPYPNNKLSLGNSSYKWTALYAASSTIVTSDRNAKKNIVPLADDLTQNFVMGLKPVSFKFIDNTSDRTHYGLISQDVEELMNNLGMSSLDFAGFIRSPKVITEEVVTIDERGREHKEKVEKTAEGEYVYSLRYEEFISPLIKMVQLQQQKIDELCRAIEAAGITIEE